MNQSFIQIQNQSVFIIIIIFLRQIIFLFLDIFFWTNFAIRMCSLFCCKFRKLIIKFLLPFFNISMLFCPNIWKLWEHTTTIFACILIFRNITIYIFITVLFVYFVVVVDFRRVVVFFSRWLLGRKTLRKCVHT